MANHPSAKKRHRQNLKRNERNSAGRARVRRAIKEARAAIAEGADDKSARVTKAVREIYRAAAKNIIATRKASRNVSRLMRQGSAQ